ncbi:hypothetical protein AXW83_05920 [Bosea sp. PAMC 26642]|nr:hypothetical protein AXW83_05920 [Bosea sp. PAMC 26642]
MDLFAQWTSLFNAGDLDGLLAIYASDASVHGTTSPNLAIGTEALKAYFTPALRAKNQVKPVGDPVVAEAGAGAVVMSGYYEFSGTRGDGQPFTVPARYSFVMIGSGTTARIAHQHSSPRPRPAN